MKSRNYYELSYLKISTVMVHKFEIIVKGLLVSFLMRGSIIVPVENFYKGTEATKRTAQSV